MSKAEVKTLMKETHRQLTHYLQELAAGNSFDMAGFEKMVLRIQQEISALKSEDAASFKEDITSLMQLLDQLQKGLEEKRNGIRQEIEGLNRQMDANKAYSKPDANK